MVREQTAVGAEHSIRSAKPLVRIAEFRQPAPQFGGAAVVSQNQTVPVTNINGKRHLFEQLPRQFEGLLLLRPTGGDASRIRNRIYLDEGSRVFAPEGP
jgi:hypothetical protein